LLLKTNELRVRGFHSSSLVCALLALVISTFAIDRQRTKRGLVDVSYLENSGVRWDGRFRL
jgi:hypothetical protein